MSASLERGVAVFKEVLDTPMASFFSSCVHCGLCAEACEFYVDTGDPKYTPIHKLDPLKRLWRQEYTLLGRIAAAFGISRPITDGELAEWSELVYDSCTLCGRCSMVCPVGNDIAYMVRAMREGMAMAGHAPEGLVLSTTRTIKSGSPMGVSLDTVKAQIRHQEKETGETIPLDQPEVDYMVLLSSMEVVNYPEYLGALAKIFKQAGVSWTLSSDGFEATNAGVQIGVSDLAREIVQRVVDAAEKLKVRGVVSPECGHAYTSLRWEGPNLIGRAYNFEVVHVVELLDRLRQEGRLHTRGKTDIPLTFHDPCQLVRRGGVIDQPRNLLRQVASDFRDVKDSGVMNWCCGGGGGVSANDRAEHLRLAAFHQKKEQLDAVGVNTLVTACANCRVVMEEALEAYHMEHVQVLGLTELVAEHLAEAEEARKAA
ncbi:MAG: (Fe-S)-binding protein [Nitrospirota bacterium]|jgi:Fe-S oxidoreductase